MILTASAVGKVGFAGIQNSERVFDLGSGGEASPDRNRDERSTKPYRRVRRFYLRPISFFKRDAMGRNCMEIGFDVSTTAIDCGVKIS